MRIMFRTFIGVHRYLNRTAISWTYARLIYKNFAKNIAPFVLGAYIITLPKQALLKAKASSKSSLIEDADQLYDELKFEKIYDLLISSEDVKDADILWRLARATYEKGKASKDTKLKKSLYEEALSYLNEAVKISDDNFAVHKWLAIVMDCYYTLEGTKSRILHLYDMKLHMEKACSLKPKDGTSWFVLGMWYYGIADISWYERKAASVFFATPPQSSYEEALNVFLKAEEVEPDFYSKNYLMIGKCLYNLGRKNEARSYLEKARDYQQKTTCDKEAKEEAIALLKKL